MPRNTVCCRIKWKSLEIMLTADLILLKIENRYFKTPFEIPEGAHGEMAFWASLQIAIMTEQLY